MPQTRLFQLPKASHQKVNTRLIKPWRSAGRNVVRKSIEALGNLTTPLLREIVDPRYRFEVIDGARRLDTLTAAGPLVIDALILPLETRDEDARAATAALNLSRAPNPLEEAYSFDSLAKAGYRVEKIAKELGISSAKIRSRLNLLRLPEPIRRAIEQKRVALGVANRVAHLPEPDQAHLVNVLATNGTITSSDVDAVRRVRREQSLASLPNELFAPARPDPATALRAAIEHALDIARSQGLAEHEAQAVLQEFAVPTSPHSEGAPAYA